MNTPHHSNHLVLPSAIALVIAHAAATIPSTNRASGLLNRNISAATGVRASADPASNAAKGLVTRLTVAYSRPTDATPINASGNRMANELTPNIRADSAMNHNAPGVLSTVMELAASDDPKKNAFQETDPAWAAAE